MTVVVNAAWPGTGLNLTVGFAGGLPDGIVAAAKRVVPTAWQVGTPSMGSGDPDFLWELEEEPSGLRSHDDFPTLRFRDDVWCRELHARRGVINMISPVDPSLLRRALAAAVVYVLRKSGWHCWHGSLLLPPSQERRPLLITGASGAGKSALSSCLMAQHGWTRVTQNYTLVDSTWSHRSFLDTNTGASECTAGRSNVGRPTIIHLASTGGTLMGDMSVTRHYASAWDPHILTEYCSKSAALVDAQFERLEGDIEKSTWELLGLYEELESNDK